MTANSRSRYALRSRSTALVLAGLTTLGCSTPVAPTDNLSAPATVLAGAAPSYRSIDLGTLGGPGTTPFDVNDAGVVVGSSNLAANSESRPFIWTQDAGMRSLADFQGSAMAVSPDGTFVGVGRVTAAVSFGHAFLGHERGSAKDLGVLRVMAGDYSVANDVNAQDEVVGTDGSGSYQAFYWSQQHGLVAIPSTGESQAFAINDRGEVAASESGSGTIPIQPFVWRASGSRTDIPVPSGLNAAKPDDINNRGDVAGDFSFPNAPNNVRGFFWSSGGGFESFGVAGNTSTVPVAVNEQGVVLGNFAQLDTGRFGAFLWTKAAGLVDLTSLLGERAVAFGLNDQGWIVGIQYQSLEPLVWRAMLWIPQSSPPNPNMASHSVTASPSASIATINPATKAALLRCFTDPAVRGNKRAFAACATGPGQ